MSLVDLFLQGFFMLCIILIFVIMKITDIKNGDGSYTCKMSFDAQYSVGISQAGISMGVTEMPKGFADSFGMWGSSNNANVFVPDAVSDILPKPEDFIGVKFRMLSATIVAGKTWRAVQFPDNVLKASTKLINLKAVFLEHDSDPLNNVGKVIDPVWVSSTTENGVTIPAGIEATIMIDAKTNPKLVRSVLSGGIYSNSVTVVFDWKPSHEFESDREFANMIGRTAEDGKMIRRIATKVHAYHESSLVHLGADPYAKARTDDGTLLNVDTSNTHHDSFSKETEDIQKTVLERNFYTTNCSLSKEILSLSRRVNNNNKVDMEQELFDILLATLGLSDVKDITKDNLAKLKIGGTDEKFTALLEKVKSTFLVEEDKVDEFLDGVDYTELKKGADTTELDSTIVTLTAEKIALETQLHAFKAIVTDKKTEAKRLFTLSGSSDDTLLSLVDKANVTELDALIQKFGDAAVNKFGGTCIKCNSKEISFRSSQVGEDGFNTTEEDKTPATTVKEIIDKSRYVPVA